MVRGQPIEFGGRDALLHYGPSGAMVEIIETLPGSIESVTIQGTIEEPFHADPAVAIPIEVDSDPWFHDYEPCGDCGFDHAYEYADAIAWHKRDDPKDGG